MVFKGEYPAQVIVACHSSRVPKKVRHKVVATTSSSCTVVVTDRPRVHAIGQSDHLVSPAPPLRCCIPLGPVLSVTVHRASCCWLAFTPRKMNFYFEAAKILDKLDKKQGSIKGVLSSVPEKDRKRTSALVIESLKCTFTFVVLNRATLDC